MPLQTGNKLGHYEVLSLLGEGGMGEVYKARDTVLKRDVALKVLHASFLRDPERMARFKREAEVFRIPRNCSIDVVDHVADGYRCGRCNWHESLQAALIREDWNIDEALHLSMPDVTL